MTLDPECQIFIKLTKKSENSCSKRNRIQLKDGVGQENKKYLYNSWKGNTLLSAIVGITFSWHLLNLERIREVYALCSDQLITE